MSSAVSCLNVSKEFGKTRAIQDLSLHLEKNKIYGLLGRNGAGKTTLLQLLQASLLPSSGEIRINGEPIFENQVRLNDLCYIKDQEKDLKEYRISTVFEIAAIFYPNWDEDYKNELINKFNLKTSIRFQKASKGMQAMVGIIIGLASRAPITMFDEPTAGLDAGARELFYNLLLEDYENYPRTVIFSTHLIDEVANVFEEVIILHNGKLKLQADVQSLKERGLYVTGNKDAVLECAKDKRIIYTEEIGSTYICGLLGEWSKQERLKAEELGVQLSMIPLQKLFVYLTEEGK